LPARGIQGSLEAKAEQNAAMIDMKRSGQFRVVLVTAPNLKAARQLARQALEGHLAACANLIPRIESHYWWQGKLEKSGEALILFKTRAGQLEKLERLVLEKHPYDTPEFVVVNLTGGAERYLDWLTRETKSQ
jgi:periplasmic divalent cation tolerance protein